MKEVRGKRKFVSGWESDDVSNHSTGAKTADFSTNVSNLPDVITNFKVDFTIVV